VKNRITAQRRIILKELKKLKTHPTAEEIYAIVKNKLPKINFSTIYRNLKYLKDNHEIIEIKSTKNKNRYDAYTKNHIHLICKKCQQIYDIFDKIDININSPQINKLNFKIDHEFLELTGLCCNCIS